MGALRCDIIIALKEDHKSQLVEQGVDRCHELIEIVDNVRKLNYISPEILKSLKRKVSQIIKWKDCLDLHPLSDGKAIQKPKSNFQNNSKSNYI